MTHPIVRLTRTTLSLALRVFFRKIELSGAHQVPPSGPVIFVLNHQNGLIDPVFLLCLSPRPVSYIAKSTLFSMPVVGWIVRAFDSLPVQRKQDRATGTSNRETFTRARDLLSRGGTLGIFPEGISHNAPKLQRFKSGAARIAFGTQLDDLKIIPAGLYYSDKAIFRSEALVLFGEPIVVQPIALDDDGEPPRDAVHQLTARIEAGLAQVMLQADAHEALVLAERVARLLASADDQPQSLGDSVALRQRLLAGYARLQEQAPTELAALLGRLRDYEESLAALDLDLDHPPAEALSHSLIMRVGLLSFGVLLALAPIALLGTALHYPAYRAVGMLSRRFSGGEDDLLATIKVLGSLLLFPLTWIGLVIAVGIAGYGLWIALALGLLAPLAGLGALHFWERFEGLTAGARIAWIWLTRRSILDRLASERATIYAEIVRLAARVEEPAG